MQASRAETPAAAVLSFQNEPRGLTFQEQIADDLDAVFFNALAKEFVTLHKIKGVRGMASKEHEIEAVVDSERYLERATRDKVENVNLNGLVFFVKKSHWMGIVKRLPRVTDELFLDGKRYQVTAVAEDMGALEVTLEALRGM